MPRIRTIPDAEADVATATTLAGVRANLGMVPNLLATLAQSSSALKGYVALKNALAGGRLTARHREIIALAVAQVNRCEYCLAAHTALAKGAGLSDAQVHRARCGTGHEALDHAVASFAAAVAREHGSVSDEVLAATRSAGLDDGLIVEIVGNVALNALTNYTNNVAQTEVDFPPVRVDVEEKETSDVDSALCA